MATSFEAEIQMLREEAIQAAERHGLELIVNPDVGAVLLDAEFDAFKVRYWKRCHEGPVRYSDFRGWTLIDCEAVLSARRHPTAVRELIVLELNRGMDAYVRQCEEKGL